MFQKSRRAFNLMDHWVDYVALLTLILGAILSILSGSLVLTYLIVFICGLVVGRYLYYRHHKHQLRFFYIVLAFVVGYIAASRFGNYKGVVFFFVIGAIVGQYIHKKGWLP